MTTITTVPFSRLVATDAINARAATKDGLDELAASIAAKGLIQPLAVRPADGDKFEVIDGRRRHAALAKLVKAKTLKKDHDVPVLIRNEDDTEALETSLIANTVRLPMHPVDQYEVFTRLSAQGRTDADIAARFGISERTVRQQRALGALAPSVRKAWRDGKIEAKAAQAFASNPDHAAQEAAWGKLKAQVKSYGGLSDYAVRSEMQGERTEVSRVEASVMARYTAAGGTVAEDLFEDARYIEDAALLTRCKAEVRAEVIAPVRARLAGQGWAWIADADDLPGAWRYQWRRLDGGKLTPEQEQQHEELLDKIADAEVGSPEQQRLIEEANAIEEAAALRDFTPEMRARAGAVISNEMYGDGCIEVIYGVIRPSEDGQHDIEDSIGARASDDDASDAEACQWCNGEGDVNGEFCDACDGTGEMCPDGSCNDDDDGGGGCSPHERHVEATQDEPFAISKTLAEAVQVQRTLAAARVVARAPELALALLLAQLRHRNEASPVRVTGRGHKEIDQRGERLVSYAKELTETGLGIDHLVRSLAPLIAQRLNLVSTVTGYTFGQPATNEDDITALVAALPGDDYLAAARDAFLAEDYFKRATKATALAALEEMNEAGVTLGLAPEDVLAGMKKADLAAAASAHAKACGWLPPELRHPDYALIMPETATTRITGKNAAAEQSSEEEAA